MATSKLNLSRKQLEAFLKDQQSIKQFEQLFKVAGTETPDATNESAIAAENAGVRAQQALDALNRIAAALELLALAPVASVAPMRDDLEPVASAAATSGDLAPPVQIGTLGQQQADRVSITGGAVTAQLSDNQATLAVSSATLSNGAAAATATLTNAPTAGNPTKWVAINDNGTTRYIPTW